MHCAHKTAVCVLTERCCNTDAIPPGVHPNFTCMTSHCSIVCSVHSSTTDWAASISCASQVSDAFPTLQITLRTTTAAIFQDSRPFTRQKPRNLQAPFLGTQGPLPDSRRRKRQRAQTSKDPIPADPAETFSKKHTSQATQALQWTTLPQHTLHNGCNHLLLAAEACSKTRYSRPCTASKGPCSRLQGRRPTGSKVHCMAELDQECCFNRAVSLEGLALSRWQAN